MANMTASSPRPLGLALVGLGLAAGGAALSIGGWGEGAWGPRTLPLLAALALLLSGAAVALSPPSASSALAVERDSVAGTGSAPREVDDAASGEWRVGALLALAALYVLAIDRVGYLAATAFAAPAAFRLFGVRRPLALLLAATLVPLLLHLAFFRVLGVFPPLGRWFDLLDVIVL